jgi:uncharacterized membrane protein
VTLIKTTRTKQFLPILKIQFKINNMKIHLLSSQSKLSSRQLKTLCIFRGLFFTFLSSIFFSLTAVIVKHVTDVHAGQMAVVRFAGMLMFSFPLAVDTKDAPLFGESSSRHWLILRGLAGATSLYLRYSALHYLSISNATVSSLFGVFFDLLH